MKQCAPLFALWLATRVVATSLVIVLFINMAEPAVAFDCLAYKPERAQGQWHADVIAGKICWYGPNWRSFLAKPKAHMENSRVTNSTPVTQVVNSEPIALKRRKAGIQTENGNPDAQVDNIKPDVPTENRKPEIAADSTLLKVKPIDAESAQESPGLREATPAEAAAFSNVASLELKPAGISNLSQGEIAPQPNLRDLLIALTVVVFGTVGLGTLILKIGSQKVDSEADVDSEALELVPVYVEIVPPLQPGAADEHQFAPSSFPEFLKRQRVQD